MPRMFRIPTPSWAKVHLETISPGFEQVDYVSIKSLRAEIERETDLAIQRYIDEEPESSPFPDLNRLSGEFYVDAPTYHYVYEEWFAKVGRQREWRFSYFAHCLEKESSSAQDNRDYLGLEVHFRWFRGSGHFEWAATDSSSI